MIEMKYNFDKKSRAEEDTHSSIESFSLKFLPVSILSFFLLTI